MRRKGLATLVQRAAHDSRSESRDAQRLKSLLELVELKSVADALQLKPLLEQAQLKPAVGAAQLKSRSPWARRAGGAVAVQADPPAWSRRFFAPGKEFHKEEKVEEQRRAKFAEAFCSSFCVEFSYVKHSAEGPYSCHGNVKSQSASCS